MLKPQMSRKALRAGTCYGLSVTAALATGNKDDIALAGISVVVFEEEELVDAIVLKC